VHVYFEYVCFIVALCLLHRVNGVLAYSATFVAYLSCAHSVFCCVLFCVAYVACVALSENSALVRSILRRFAYLRLSATTACVVA